MKPLLLSLCLLLQTSQPPLVVPVCPPPTTINLACVQAANAQHQFELALIANAYSHDVQWHHDELMTAWALCDQYVLTQPEHQQCKDAAEHIYNVQMAETQALHNRLVAGAWEALGDALEECCQ